MNCAFVYKLFPRYRFLLLRHKVAAHSPLRILDVGCGNHSPTITKLFFPRAHYTGLDRDPAYNLDEEDRKNIDEFILMDLTQPEWDRLKDNTYDVIILAHVIEHILQGEAVLTELWKKLKPGGYLYVETPSERSLSVPSMPGTLNFFDDPTHVRLYTLPELCNLFLRLGGHVQSAGLCRQKRKIVFLPLLLVLHLLRYGTWKRGALFWDLTGFAHHVLVRKPEGQGG